MGNQLYISLTLTKHAAVFQRQKSTKNARNTKPKESHNLSLGGTALVICARLILYYYHNQAGMQAARGGETLSWWHECQTQTQECRMPSPSLVAVPSAWVCPSFSLPQPCPFLPSTSPLPAAKTCFKEATVSALLNVHGNAISQSAHSQWGFFV